jgi:uncharacterized protein (TIGR02284 family)
MSSPNDIAVETLNDLIETCADGEQGYRRASDDAKDPQLRALFNQYTNQRAMFAAELQDEVLRLGGAPREGGSAAGALHRGWMSLRAAVAGRSDEEIVAECERGEDAAVRSYKKAMDRELPADIRVLIEREFLQIKDAHDRIRALERASAQK